MLQQLVQTCSPLLWWGDGVEGSGRISSITIRLFNMFNYREKVHMSLLHYYSVQCHLKNFSK